ncbi:hypothetical protein [Oceaniglobus ichthyenteri]|uniref:hypothetical protein n=1 Tax=Oceaniglobus ichthyenteri TaxID=2136177 RepID=UPI00197E40BD|nr:hypothetical protein [Oceaniglobus ichthyenteri]
MSAAFTRRAPIHMAGAFLAMGGWAVFANRAHPMPEPVVAGVLQGTISAVITLFLKRMIETVAARLAGLSALIVPSLVAGSVSLVLLVVLHGLANTPEIAATIAVPLMVSTGYAFLYSLSLWRS